MMTGPSSMITWLFRKKVIGFTGFQGQLPVFYHHVANEQLFRLFCRQKINTGTATSAQISGALCVNREKLSRWAREDRSSNPSESRLTSNVSASPSKKKPLS